MASALRELTEHQGNLYSSLFQKDKKPKYQKFLFLKRIRKGQWEDYFLNIIHKSLGGAGIGWIFFSFQAEVKYSVQDVVSVGNSV